MNDKHINKKSYFSIYSKKRKALLLTSASLIASVPIFSSLSVSDNLQNSINSYKGAYGLGDKNFSSYSQLISYVNSNSQIVKTEGNNSKWTISLNGITKTYDDPNLLRKDLLDSNITVKKIKTDLDLSNYASSNGILGLTNPNIWTHISNDINSKNIAYQGAGDQTFLNENDAYMSYFQTKQGYVFNGINFSDKSSLKSYLEKEYFPNRNDSLNTVTIFSPNGNSLPINLNKTDAYEILTNFINENAETSLNYKTNNGYVITIDKNNVDSITSKVEIKDLNYQHVQSNEGESRYIIDNFDDADLIGPYFYNGVLDVSSFMDKSMWKKVNGVTKNVYLEGKIDSSIGNFFSSIINDDNNLNKIQAEDENSDTLLFRTLLADSEGNSYDKWFLNELKMYSPELAKSVIDANDYMMTGKKYNSFNKIPVLYSFLMQRAISWGLDQKVISLIVDYFTNVCNFIQDVLEFVSLYSKDLLLNKDKKHSFNMVDFFQIGNPEYDINTSTAYFLNQLKNNYPNLVALSLAYTQSETNVSLAGGLIPYESLDFDVLWETELMSAKDLYSINQDLKNVYDIFSQLKINDMSTLYVLNNKNSEIKNISNDPDTSKWIDKLKLVKTKLTNQSIGDLLSSIGSKNNQYYSLAESILNTEIKIFLESGAVISGGYLDKLIVLGKSKKSLSTFVNFVKKNEGVVSSYRVYLAFILDLKNNLNILDKDSTSNVEMFARRLSLLVQMVFGSSILVGNSFYKLYQSWDSIPSAMKNKTLDLLDGKSEYIYEIIDLSGKKWDKSLNLQEANKDGRLSFQDEILDVNHDFVNPSIASNGLENASNHSIILADLSEEIRNSPINWDDNIVHLVSESNELRPISRVSNASVIMDPIDNVSLAISNSFDLEDDVISMVTNSIYSGSWGQDIPGFDNSDIGTRPGSNHYQEIDFSHEKKSWSSGHTSKFNKLKEGLLTGLNHSLEIFASVISITEIVFFFLDLFKETYIQNFYQYTTSDGTSFYWNGGLNVSKYFGFDSKEITNIDDMKLIKPVQITLPQIEEYYYYSGIKFYNPNELKRKVILNYLNNVDSPINSKFKKSYFLINEEGTSSTSIEKLISNVIDSLNIFKNDDGSFDTSNLNKNSPYIKMLSASYDYGYIIPENDNNTSLINNILENIRPANFVSLPKLSKNGTTIGVANSVDKLPGKYWDGYKIIDNGQNENILIDNSANELKDDFKNEMILTQEIFKITNANEANKTSLNNLFNDFKNKFTINSKEFLNSGFNSNKFSELGNEIKIQNIYEVKDQKTGRILTFIDLDKASQYLLNNANFTKVIDYNGTMIYFDGKYFKDKNDLLKWVHKNMFSI